MFLTTCLSILSLWGAAAVAVMLPSYIKVRKINIIFAGVFLSLFCIYAPMCSFMFASDGFSPVKTFLLSLYNVICVFLANGDFEKIREFSVGNVPFVYNLFIFHSLFLYLLAPIMTFGFVLSFFRNTLSYVKYILFFRKRAYILSELNERSIILARNIKKNDEFKHIVFCSVSEENPFIHEAGEIGAVCLRRGVCDIKIFGDSNIFMIGNDESENTADALKLTYKYFSLAINVYVFASKPENALLLSSVSNCQALRLLRLDMDFELVFNMLYERGHIIFDSARELSDGKKLISAVVVGLHGAGREMLRALPWFCQMDGYRVSINAFDEDSLAEEKFTFLCPELMSPEHNGTSVDGDAEYEIKIHSGISPDTKSFADSISEISDASFVFVSLGDDERNINVSVNLRMLFARAGLHPKITAVVENPEKSVSFKALSNFRGERYDIDIAGSFLEAYSESRITDSALRADALSRHLKWGSENDFFAYEYCRRSSCAAAIHMLARARCGLAYANKRAEELSESERDALECLEHKRWNAFMRSEGYVFAPNRDDIAKTHNNLVPFRELSETDKRKDSAVGTN